MPFSDGPSSGSPVYYKDRVGGRLLRVEECQRHMTVVPWGPVAGHLEFGGHRVCWAINQFEFGGVGGRGICTTGGGQEGGECNRESDCGAGTLHRVHRTYREISQGRPLVSVIAQSRAEVPVVSRSITQNVTSEIGIPRSPRLRCV